MAPAVAIILACSLAACSTPDETGTTAQRVQAWAAGTSFQKSAAALRADVARIRRNHRTAKASVVEFNCYTLGQDAMKANAKLVTPDHTLSLELSKAYDSYYNYALSCVHDKGAAAPLDALAPRLAAGDREMAKAQARLHVLTGAPAKG
ncbi:MAG: hypothetical protein ACRD0J_08550 [Acidimicrobiales bacterium]